jgi:hypothetical protein
MNPLTNLTSNPKRVISINLSRRLLFLGSCFICFRNLFRKYKCWPKQLEKWMIIFIPQRKRRVEYIVACHSVIPIIQLEYPCSVSQKSPRSSDTENGSSYFELVRQSAANSRCAANILRRTMCCQPQVSKYGVF